MPDEILLTEMAEEPAKARIMLVAERLQPTSKGVRVRSREQNARLLRAVRQYQ